MTPRGEQDECAIIEYRGQITMTPADGQEVCLTVVDGEPENGGPVSV